MRVVGATAFYAFVLVIVGALFAPVLFGLQRYVIAGHSMTGTIPYGSVVYGRKVPASTLKVGDVITYTPPFKSNAGAGKPITHRLIKIAVMDTSEGRQRVYQTKGDFNRAEDPGPITLKSVALYRFHIPYVGLAFIYLSRYGLFIIGIPALIFGVLPMVRLWKAAGQPNQPASPDGPWISLRAYGLSRQVKYVKSR